MASKFNGSFSVSCSFKDIYTLEYSKDFETAQFEFEIFNVEPTDFFLEVNHEIGVVDLALKSQDNEGNICFDTSIPIRLAPEYESVPLEEIDAQKLFKMEMHHDYEMFEEVENLFNFSIHLTIVEDTLLCLQLIFTDPLAISLYGQESLTFDFEINQDFLEVLEFYDKGSKQAFDIEHLDTSSQRIDIKL